MLFLFFIAILFVPNLVQADVDPVAVRISQKSAWVGQRVSIFVELRTPGSFTGSASFDWPKIPGTLVMKIGSPVVGSREIDGTSWFVQTHEFALFSQRSGTLEVPQFPVRFSGRSGFTGPVTDVQAKCPGFNIDIRRPPGSEHIAFLISTESFNVHETWSPPPGPAIVGAVFKRTITQRAQQLPAMALAPAPSAASDGLRTYVGDITNNDKLERGDFLGERQETITYLVQQPGTLTLPQITYTWWNPTTTTLMSTVLPAITFDVTEAVISRSATLTDQSSGPWLLVAMLLVAILLAGLVIWQWPLLFAWGAKIRGRLTSPDRTAARKLLTACRKNNASAAYTAWSAWLKTQRGQPELLPELRKDVLDVQRQVFGPVSDTSWNGDSLRQSFARQPAMNDWRPADTTSVLPPMNP